MRHAGTSFAALQTRTGVDPNCSTKDAIYDVFGNHQTALKGGVSKYETPLVQGNLKAFNPMLVTSQSRAWINTGGCTGPTCFPTDGQIGSAPSGGFGTLTPRSLDPNFRREFNVQYSAGIQHESGTD